MPIGVWGYLDELAEERVEIDAAIDEVLRSGRLILGRQVESFEKEFAAYCGVAHGVGVNSGTDALFLALRALGVGPGHEVITVANTAVPTVAAIVSSGAAPRFVDIDPDTYLIDPDLIRAAITPQTRCLLVVHLFGQCADMTRIRSLADEHELALIEDCAQSHGATHHGRRAGSMSDIAAYSFYPTKILGGYGDGGMVVTDDEALAARVRRLRFYGMDDRYYSVEHGYNSRLDELHAAILLRKLARLDGYIERRRQLAGRYERMLSAAGLTLPRTAPGNEHAWYLYVARHPERDRIIDALREHDVLLNVSYRWPIHTMPAYARSGFGEGDLPHTEAACREIFSLPMYPSLGDHDQERVCDLIRTVV